MHSLWRSVHGSTFLLSLCRYRHCPPFGRKQELYRRERHDQALKFCKESPLDSVIRLFHHWDGIAWQSVWGWQVLLQGWYTESSGSNKCGFKHAQHIRVDHNWKKCWRGQYWNRHQVLPHTKEPYTLKLAPHHSLPGRPGHHLRLPNLQSRDLQSRGCLIVALKGCHTITGANRKVDRILHRGL